MIAVIALLCIFGAFIPWAIRNDRAEHLIHTTNCEDCEA